MDPSPGDECFALLRCPSLLARPSGRLLAEPGIDKYERLADALNEQRAVRRVLGNKEIAGVVYLSDLVAQQPFSIRIEVQEIFVIASDEGISTGHDRVNEYRRPIYPAW